MFPWEKKKLITQHQMRIIELIWQKRSHADIAERFGCSVSSIDGTCVKILRRLQLDRMTDIRPEHLEGRLI